MIDKILPWAFLGTVVLMVTALVSWAVHDSREVAASRAASDLCKQQGLVLVTQWGTGRTSCAKVPDRIEPAF